MKTVKLHGELGRVFGVWHEFEINSAAEAIRALSANFAGFRDYMYGSDARGIGYHVLVDTHIVDTSELDYPVHSGIQFLPVIRGAGSGDTKILLGSALIAAGVIVAAASGGGLTGVGLGLVKVGAALTITGVIQTMTPIPGAPTPSERPGSDPSYTFNGPVNTSAQGQPVPIGYGRLTVGSAVISAGISVDELVSPQAELEEKLRGFRFDGGL